MLFTQILFLSYKAHALTPTEIAKKVNPATVGLYAASGTDKYYGTGVIISPEGHILTSTTVIPDNTDEITVYFSDHTRVQAEVIRRSENSQSVLLKISSPAPRQYPFLSLNTFPPSIGEDAYTAGNANNMIKLGDGVSFSAGVVSGIYSLPSSPESQRYTGTVIETDAAINDGQDGGGLINSNAEVIGIISKDYSTLRWQGTSIPVSAILQDLQLTADSPAGFSILSRPSTETADTFTADIQKIADSLITLKVERLYESEKIAFPDWKNYNSRLKDWNDLSPTEQRRKLVDFFSAEKLVTANQMIRRPEDAVTGIIISSEGHILTSAFNVESSDSVFVRSSDNSRKLPEYINSIEDLTKYDINAFEKITNRVISIEVTLADGSTKNAEILGFNLPLGTALLKISPDNTLPYYDINSNSTDAILGEDIAILGKYADSCTINTGIISAANRDNGNYFQVDALLNYGNSGGPVINKAGQFLGIATRPLSPSPVSGIILPFSSNGDQYSGRPALSDYNNSPNSGIAMAAKAERIISSLPEMINGAGISKSQSVSLGIHPDQKKAFSNYIIVDTVQKNSPAEKAGFQKGDIIKSLDGVGVRSWQEIYRYIAQKQQGQVITFVIERPLEKPYLLLNGKKIDTIEKLNNFILNNNDQNKVNGKIFKPSITQKIYVTLD